MFDVYEDSLTFTQTKALVAQVLQSAGGPMTVRQLKQHIAEDTYLWDCLLALEASKTIENVGSLMISKWVHRRSSPKDVKTRICVVCKEELPLVEFHQEWSGAPSAKCRACKTESQKRRGRKRTKA